MNVLKDFYYKGNPRFGDEIYIDEDFALYGVKEKTGKRAGRTGYIYAAYQLRKHIPFPLVVCCHDFESKNDDREREDIRDSEALECILRVLRCLDSEKAIDVLERLKDHWSGKKVSKYDMPSKPILELLIKKVSYNNNWSQRFSICHKAEIAADFSPNISRNRRRIAFSWYRNSGIKKRIVIHDFNRIGIPDIEKLCEEAEGFEIVKLPDNEEKQYINILEETAEKYYSDIYQYDSLPECRIIINDNVPVDGLALSADVISGSKNSFGLKVRQDVKSICLERRVLKRGSLGDALSVYLHELLHQYGGDCSRQFHKAIMIMNRRTASVIDEIGIYRKKWEEVHDRNKKNEE